MLFFRITKLPEDEKRERLSDCAPLGNKGLSYYLPTPSPCPLPRRGGEGHGKGSMSRGAGRWGASRSAFSVVELLCAIAISSLLMALLLPVVQSIRESGRNLACRHKLRQIALAALAFETQFNRFPTGTMGLDAVPAMTQPEQTTWFQLGGPWEDYQHTSSLVFLLPHLELNQIYDQLPAIATRVDADYQSYRNQTGGPHWIGHLPELDSAIHARVPQFACPSAVFSDAAAERCVVATQPHLLVGPNGEDLGDYFGPAYQFDRSLGRTNYLGCAGAHSGGETPDPDRRPYTGVMSCRRRLSSNNVLDGLGHTILYGENLGEVDAGIQTTGQSWFFGGLARGRGHWPWKGIPPVLINQPDLLGDAFYAAAPGFASAHPAGVNFALCDGSVRVKSRAIFWPELYALCGATDRQVVEWE